MSLMSHFNMKRFVQGPNLHEESIARNATEVVSIPSQLLTGEQAKQVYEEIISSSSGNWKATTSKLQQPSSSSRNSSNSTVSNPNKRKSPPQPPKKNLNQLMALCESNLYSELESYIKSPGFNINEQDNYGWSLLMSAACAGANDCLRLLLRNGASPSLKDKKGLDAGDLAKKNRRKEAVSILDEWCRLFGNRNGVVLIDLEDETSSLEEPNPIFCDACNQSFTNQNTHLKSIAHLFSSGEFHCPDGKVHFGIPESNIGFQLMLKTGWDKTTGLGPDGTGQKFPIKTVLKRDRQGVGNVKDKKSARITHFAPFDPAAVEGPPRAERETTVEKKAQLKRKSRETRKEIHYRRQLSSL